MRAAFALLLCTVASVHAADEPFTATDTTNVGFEAAGITYTPTTNVYAHQMMSKDVCDIKTLLNEEPTPYSTIKAKYVEKLQGLANTAYDGDHFKLFEAYYRSATHVDAFIMGAMEPAASSPWLVVGDAARKEAIEKGVWDQIGIQSFLGHLDAAFTTAKAGDTAAAHAHLDSAFAFYVGRNDGCTPYARAQKRAANYNTWADAGNSIATVNKNVMQALVSAKAALSAGNSIESTYNTIVANIKTIYIQASLRYLNKLDADFGMNYADHQGEGWAFWRVVEPYYNNVFEHTVITAFYDVANPVAGFSHYCTGMSVMMDNLPAGVTSAMVGTLSEAAGVTAGRPCKTTKGMKQTHAGVEYTIKSIVNSGMDFSAHVANIMVDNGNQKWDDLYAGWENSGLKAAAVYNDGQDVMGLFRRYYNSVTWIDDLVVMCKDGTDGGWTDVSARQECLQKTIWDATAVKAVVDSLVHAMGAATSGSYAEALYFWDHAYAIYTGHDAPNDLTIFARANKRAANYGTYAASGKPDALANELVLKAMAAGQALLSRFSPTASGLEVEADKALEAIQVVYYQASLRYLHKIDVDLIQGVTYAEHKGEGAAFWRVVAPIVADDDNDNGGAAKINGFYDMAKASVSVTEHYMFCEGRDILAATLPTGATMGTLEDTSDINCANPAPMPTPAPTAASTGTTSAAPAMYTRMGIFAALLGAAARLL